MSHPWQEFSPARIELDFADGSYTFALPWRMVAELQQSCGTDVRFTDGSTGKRPKGFGQIWMEVRDRVYSERDLREVVRLGLIGGKGGVVGGEAVVMTPTKAIDLVRTYVGGEDDRIIPTDSLWALAFAILAATAQGYSPPRGGGEPPGEAGAAGETP